MVVGEKRGGITFNNSVSRKMFSFQFGTAGKALQIGVRSVLDGFHSLIFSSVSMAVVVVGG